MNASRFNVILIGAGEINFGSVEGPWNHSLRLEKKLGDRLRIVAIVDPDVLRAELALKTKQTSAASDNYRDTGIFDSLTQARAALTDDQLPNLIILGVPPFARGTDVPGQDLELQAVKLFPGCPLFVEKPVCSVEPAACHRVAAALEAAGTLVGVGYMLRYLKAVQMMKTIIDENGLTVMGTNARYVMAYEWARKLAWWDKTRSGGPIVEQATHFCDLSRYFGGEVVLPSVYARTVEHSEPPGHLSVKQFDEDAIPTANRVPRMTSATWKYQGGAVGSLTHVIALHGNTYSTEFEVYADGYQMKLVNPYGISPMLSVRRPGVEAEEIHTFQNDDPFYSEISAFIDAAEDRAAAHGILSSYRDALATYELTWRIREASEASLAARV
ncbi:hypothetical protein PUNSTDRAFT_98745 [Punctularia strigosozonata HHB-11173 SS5]|uniref:uncharacterized protein n=1 Tax=Punctularia strigosozonata (strain HHB-11173) TaxID=741275 RepID=UPI000441647A|nr:uncharacterized protein PUNSTDRAFT_98745 [Punctularia strigosozonata HHB-11173 SS5]EIN11584.1 hypothetical protein PUNSTDRAFT_98745 [Punctularia strigosozonata HHB-11173 SS5]